MSLFNNEIRMGASSAGAYEIERSLRFNAGDSTNLTYTPGSDGNLQKFTFSFWLKKAWATSNGVSNYLFSAYTGSGTDRICLFDQGEFQMELQTGGEWRSTRKLRDPTAWYHIVCAFDTTQASASNRAKVYINGEQITDWQSSFNGSALSQNQSLAGWNNSGQIHHIGSYASGSTASGSGYMDGYVTEFNFIDDQQLAPTSFGEFSEETGAWTPIKYTGTYNSNSYYLNFSDNSNTTSTTLGKDYSGNSNNWTLNNFSITAGTDNDSFIDTPTNNFCTMSSLTHTGVTISNGALTIAPSGNNNGCFSNMQIPSTGKWYFEMKKNSGDPMIAYSVRPDLPRAWQPHTETDALATYFYGNRIEAYYDSNSVLDVSDAPWNNDADGTVFGVLWDRDNNTIKHRYNNGDEVNLSEPTGIRNQPLSFGYSVTTTWPAGSFTYNFGASGFAYTIPTGYKRLCTADLPDPVIKNPKKHFGTTLYTGSESAQVINDLEFTPDLVVNKYRAGNSHVLWIDRVRGFTGTGMLTSVSGSAEGDEQGDVYGYITSSANGFTHAAGTDGSGNQWAQMNTSGRTFVNWCWLADGTSGSSNTDGDITSTVSANTTAGFSIVKYSGTGNDAHTVGHGLGVAPHFIIIKRRDAAGSDWRVYHKRYFDMAVNETFILNSTSGGGVHSGVFDTSTPPTSTVFRPNDETHVNASGGTHVAWCWAQVEGYSKFDVYQGSGDNDGAYVHCGFKPAFLLVKHLNSSGSEQWVVYDNVRDTENVTTVSTTLGSNAPETTDDGDRYVDFLANGFKLKGGDGATNDGSYDYIYAAFAETPFKYATAE